MHMLRHGASSAWFVFTCGLLFVLDALSERLERETRRRRLIDQALAPHVTVAAASQGLSLHRSR
jgi:hypothetical protein